MKGWLPVEKSRVTRIAENLDWVLRYFAADPAGSMATLEEMYRTSRAGLMAEAVSQLTGAGENPGHISLVAFLVKKQELLPLLSDSGTALAQRIRLAKLGIRVDGQLDQALADRILASPSDQDRHDLLEILSQTRVRTEVVERLEPLLRDPNPRVHSKMAFLMAKAVPEGAWVQEGLADADPRVRANVVEALWHQKSAFANKIFHRAAGDAHHRVAANAIHGLYLQGDPEALPMIRHLLQDSNGLARRAGLWLVERTRDPRYLALLGKLIGKVEPEARPRCLKVIQTAKARKEQSMQRGALKLEWFAAGPGLGRFSAVLGERHLTNLHPFDLNLQAGGQVVDRFALKARPAEEGRRIVLLAGECPKWRSMWRDVLPTETGLAGEKFGFYHYAPEPPEAPAPAAKLAPVQVAFSLLGVEIIEAIKPEPEVRQPEVTVTAALVERAPAGITWSGVAFSSLRRTFDRVKPGGASLGEALRQAVSLLGAGGQTHFVVLDERGEFLAADVTEDLAEQPFSLDVVSLRVHEGVARRCVGRRGKYEVVESGEEAARYVAALYQSWQADYDVTFAKEVEVDGVEVFSESGYGAMAIDNPKAMMVGAQGLEPRASSV